MTVTDPLVVVAPLVGLLTNCASQVAIANGSRGGQPYRSMAAGILVGFVVSLALTGAALWRGNQSLVDCVALHVVNVVSYLALAFGYFNFVNLAIASLRIRLLGEIQAAGGSLERSRLLAAYDTRRVIELRFDRLVRGGHLQERNGLYTLGKRRFLVVALVYNCLRWLVIGPWPSHDADAQGRPPGNSGDGASSTKT